MQMDNRNEPRKENHMKVEFIKHGKTLQGPLTIACLPKRFIDATRDPDPDLEGLDQ